jgi:predicted permease
MRDWKEYVRQNLEIANAKGHLEAEIVEEIASQLHDCFVGALTRGASEKQADEEARSHVTDWTTLAADIVRSNRVLTTSKTARRLESSEQSLRNRGGRWASVANLLRELRFSLRRLRKSPGFSAVVLVTFAVGIGANTAIFSLANGVLLRPLAYDEPEQLVGVWNTAPGMGMDLVVQSPAIHFTYVDESRVFEDVGLWNSGTVAVTGLDEAAQEAAIWMTEGVLPALRTQPVLGRTFSPDDATPETPRTIILDWSYWQTRFGGDPGVVGQTLRVDGVAREIIGVLPEGFRMREYTAAIYLPYRFDRSRLFVGNFSYQSVARLRPEITIDQANAELARLIPIAVEKFPGGIALAVLEEAQFAPLVRPLKTDLVGNVGNVLWILLGTAGIVLLIACANVANLSLARAEGQDRGIAVRTALGAGRAQLAVQSVSESIMLGILGGVLGLGLAYVSLQTIMALAPSNLPRLHEISLDKTVLCFTGGISILAGFLIGLLPILRHRDLCLVRALKEGGRGSGSIRERFRARNTLVVAQMALALVLLVGSGLMIRSLQELRKVDPGFRGPESVLTLRITIPSAEVEDLVEMVETHHQIASGIGELPGVSSVGLTSSITMGFQGGANDGIDVEGFPHPEDQLPPMRRFKWIGPGYFETMQNPVIAGRGFTWDDVRSHSPAVVVTENFAREYWGEPDAALGKRIAVASTSTNWREIVGVVGNIRDDGVAQDPTSTIFWPLVANNPWADNAEGGLFAQRTLTYAIRTSRIGSTGLLSDIRETVWSTNTNLPVANVRTLANILARSTAGTSFTLVMLGVAAAVALLLGTIGVYGVISYVVSQRTREIGVRIALGAQKRSLVGMVLRQGLTLAVIGVFLGLGASYATTRLLSGLLFGVEPVDPITYTVVAFALTVVALFASYLPARRAASVDPTEALRAE